jgi:DUF1365 family protein
MTARMSSSLRFFPCLLSILPSAIGLNNTTWPFFGLWVLGSVMRWFWGDRCVFRDNVLFGFSGALIWRRVVWRAGKELYLAAVVPELEPSTTTLLVCTASLALLGTSLFGLRGLVRRRNSPELKQDITELFDLERPRALIFPCRTMQAHVFPKRHTFNYSNLMCGIPIIPLGTRSDGVEVGSGKDRTFGKWWMRVQADDYLIRGYGEFGFYNKLKYTLQERGVSDSEWLYAYLVTAPRFFGYSFSPLSIWYIYNRSHNLQKMLLEFGNTFGQRQTYLLHGSSLAISTTTSKMEEHATDSLRTHFNDTWLKDFHILPFDSRKGTYSLKALNPFPTHDFSDARIDNTITLESSKDKAELVARVHSIGAPLDIDVMGVWSSLSFTISWWWVGFVTISRILWETFKIYVHRSLLLWSGPEALSSSMGRLPTAQEKCVYHIIAAYSSLTVIRVLQQIFLQYLNIVVGDSSVQWNIIYYTAIPDVHPYEPIASWHIQGQPIRPKKLEIRVLTPAFYTRFVHHAHTTEAFERECLSADEHNRTIWVSDPELLRLLLQSARPKPDGEEKHWEKKRGLWGEWRWTLLKKLRCPPAGSVYPVIPPRKNFAVDDSQTSRYSDLDVFMCGTMGYFRSNPGSYRRLVTKLFLAQRFTLGFAGLVDFADLLLRGLLCYMGIKMLKLWAENTEAYSFPRKMSEMRDGTEWLWHSCTALAVCSCHLYNIAKGYM